MDRFGLIQLSDLQFGSKHVFGLPSIIARKLAIDINEQSAKYSFSSMYILLTGDITETAHADEFIDAYNQIEILRREISVDSDCVIIIPGNHDINRKLSSVGKEVGNPNLKFQNFSDFCNKLSGDKISFSRNLYPKVVDHRLKLDILLLNSCEKEDENCHVGYVNADKLIATLNSNNEYLNKTESYTKICMLHHRLDTTVSDKRSAIENAIDIESILCNHNFKIILTGHVHYNICHEINKHGKSIIYSGTGSTGVDKSQREDGTQNQYSIHVIDMRSKTFETLWRSYNPNKSTKLGIGGWVDDNSSSGASSFELPYVHVSPILQEDVIADLNLKIKLNIRSNPFTYSNAEKISSELLLDLFVSNDVRHLSASRLSGDAIIRGRRGAGKTMLLRFLNIYGNNQFDLAISNKKTAESFPVFVTLSKIHKSEWGGSIDEIFASADKLIYESVLEAIESKVLQLRSESFKNSVYKLKVKLKILENQEGSLIAKLGKAIQECLGQYFQHILLLLDEVAPVFPKEFFKKKEDGFFRWMNTIRNSGPYYTRVAVYPNDVSDVLNEERFGTIVNLDYGIRTQDDFIAFRQYCREVVNKYLNSVAVDIVNCPTISNIIQVIDNNADDALEQLVYASDGSSRRFLSLMDKCLNNYIKYYDEQKRSPLDKSQVLQVIKEFSLNLLSGYSITEQELAQSIAKACKRQGTFRFKLPGFANMLYPLYANREELNMVKIAELGTGTRASTYEFTYPYCILMDIQTHYQIGSRKLCYSRDFITGEWISQITTITKEHLDVFESRERMVGVVSELDENMILIFGDDGNQFISEDFPEQTVIGSKMSFFSNDDIAFDVILLS